MFGSRREGGKSDPLNIGGDIRQGLRGTCSRGSEKIHVAIPWLGFKGVPPFQDCRGSDATVKRECFRRPPSMDMPTAPQGCKAPGPIRIDYLTQPFLHSSLYS
eukprot:3090636-Pyramimonas_sp.AAC.1